MAKLTKTITGVPDGEIYPREIEEGEECPAGLESYAASIGALGENKAAKKAPETK